MSDDAFESFKEKATKAIEGLERDHQRKIVSARANGEGLYVEIKGTRIAIYSPPLEDFYAGLRRAAAALKIDPMTCEGQIRQFEEHEGVPWAVHEIADGQSFWHFGRFDPPESQN